MKTWILLFLCLCSAAQAQLTMPANGGSVRGYVGERIGITDVKIEYGRPALKGRAGHVWGELVHEGFMDDASFGTPRKIPWRAGANENTTIEFSTEVLLEGVRIPAGKYGLFLAWHPQQCTLILSRNTEGWGSYFYDSQDDIARIPLKPLRSEHLVERLSYGFADQTDSTAVVSLEWEHMRIPFRISTELQQLQLATLYRELNSTRSFNPSVWLEAANYLSERNLNMEDALRFINRAAASAPTFYVQRRKAEILEQMGRKQEAGETMGRACTAATHASHLHFYGRELLGRKENKRAFEVFRMNYQRFPDEYTTNVGMARGYAALGRYKEALKYAQKAVRQAPDATNRTNTERLIRLLKEGRDING